MNNKKYGISANQISRYGFKLCLEVYEKYNRKCSECGSEDYLAIHHIDGKGRNYEEKGIEPNNSLDNLQLVCRSCHGRLHGSSKWKYGEDEYRWAGREKEYMREYKRRPEYREYQKKYYQANKEKFNKKKLDS